MASQSAVGMPFLTGSEEERGPLFDITGEHFETRRLPVDPGDAHGHKIRLGHRRRAARGAAAGDPDRAGG